MGNMKGLVTLLFFKIKSTNLASWGIFIQIFQKIIGFLIQSFHDVIIGIFQGPVTIFEGISSKFGKLGCFDMSIKVSVFHKHSFIYWYFIAENVFDTNDVIMTSLEGTQFILAMGTDHRVSRKWKLLSISDLFLVYPNNEIKTPKIASLTFYDTTVTS